MKLQVVTKGVVCILVSPFCCSAASDLYLYLSIPKYYKGGGKAFLKMSDHVNNKDNLFFPFLPRKSICSQHKKLFVCMFVRVRKSGDVQAFANLE